MAIPLSGTVSISDVRAELQNTGTTNNFSLKLAGRPTTGAPGTFQNPLYVPLNNNSRYKPDNTGTTYSLSEWRGYNHTGNATCSVSVLSPSLGTFYTYYKFLVEGDVAERANIEVQSYDAINHWLYIYLEYPFNNVGQITSSPWTYSYFTASSVKTIVRDLENTTEALHFVIYEDAN